MPAYDCPDARRVAVQMRLALYQHPIAPAILEPLLAAWRAQREAFGPLGVVRSSALVEDRSGSSFAGQFESFLGLDNETDFITAVRACWAALWDHHGAPLHGALRTLPRRHRDGHPGAAA